jgi:hypothetical protein
MVQLEVHNRLATETDNFSAMNTQNAHQQNTDITILIGMLKLHVYQIFVDSMSPSNSLQRARRLRNNRWRGWDPETHHAMTWLLPTIQQTLHKLSQETV